MSSTFPQFETTPDTYSATNGHWDVVRVVDPLADAALLQIKFQNGPVREAGINGVQLPEVLRICLARYQMMNKTYPCRENSIVITKLQEALMWDDERTSRRTRAGVEGYDRPDPDAQAGN